MTSDRRWAAGVRTVLEKSASVEAGIVCLALLTLIATFTQSSGNLYIYCSFLMACIGAIALNLLMGTAGQVSLGNSAFLLIGGFSAIWFQRIGAQFPLDVFGSVAVCAVAGLIVGLPALRLRSLFLALSTLAAFFIALYVGNWYQGRSPETSTGFVVPTLFRSYQIDGAIRRWAWLLCAVLALIILGARRLMTGKSGRAWRMIREYEVAAPALGIEVARYKLLVFVISSMAIGLQGALSAHFTGLVSTDNYTLLLSVQYVAMILIGGLDSIAGAMIGAAIVVTLPTIGTHFADAIVGQANAATKGPQIAQIAYGVLIIVFVTSSSQGIVGWIRQIRRHFLQETPQEPTPKNIEAADERPVAPAKLTEATASIEAGRVR